jgi:hypothetical protein
MLALLRPALPARVSLVASDGFHCVSTEIPHGEAFDPVALSAYGDFELVQVEVFPLRYRWVGMFAHLYDCDQDGETVTMTVSFPVEVMPTRQELSRIKAAYTGYRLVDAWLVDNSLDEF